MSPRSVSILDPSRRARTRAASLLGAILLLCALLVAPLQAACVATPQPEPPSLDPAAMTLVATGPDTMRATGAAGAVRDAGDAMALRLTIPRSAELGGRIVVPLSREGAFSGELTGMPGEVIFIELIEAGGDRFLLAVSDAGDGVAASPPGGDMDADGSPDAIDCAPSDATLVGRDCPATSCRSDMDCAAGQTCAAGVCTTGCAPAEICTNGIDDDCNGLIDDGC